jgi:hypothetical protein
MNIAIKTKPPRRITSASATEMYSSHFIGYASKPKIHRSALPIGMKSNGFYVPFSLTFVNVLVSDSKAAK